MLDERVLGIDESQLRFFIYGLGGGSKKSFENLLEEIKSEKIDRNKQNKSKGGQSGL